MKALYRFLVALVVVLGILFIHAPRLVASDPCTSISGLRCLQASTIAQSDGSAVTSWTDYSSNAIVFTCTGSTGTVYRTSVSAFGNKPAVQFDGSTGKCISSESPAWGDFTVIVVYEPTATGAYNRIMEQSTFATGMWLGHNATGGSTNWGGEVLGNGVGGVFVSQATSVGHIIMTGRTGSTHVVYGDGWLSQQSESRVSTTTASGHVAIGAANAGTDFLTGYVAAMYYAPSYLTSAQFDQIFAYLSQTYSVKGYAVSEPATWYLSAFTNANDSGTNLLRTFTSYDGSTWGEVTGGTYSTTSGALRDPTVFKDGSTYYVTTTDTSAANAAVQLKEWAIGSSTDGINFSPLAQIDFSGSISGLFTTWAPRPYIEGSNVHVFFVASTQNPFTGGVFQVYETHPSTPGVYTAWSAATPITVTGVSNLLDPFVMKRGSTYYMLYKDVAAARIHAASSATLTGTYTVIQSTDFLGIGLSEAPFLFVPASADRIVSLAGNSGPLDFVDELTGDWTTGGSTWTSQAALTQAGTQPSHGGLLQTRTPPVVTFPPAILMTAPLTCCHGRGRY